MNGRLTVLRVRVEGAVTSFRYPHFLIGVQPTYPMPPPSTLYGHVCSTLGEQIDPGAFRMAVHFTHQGRFVDYEHTHMFAPASKGAQDRGKLSPTERELLFQPRLTLYLDQPDWLEAFRQPRYVVVLGRSQDLMRYAEVSSVTLIWADQAYVEHALLPLEQADSLRQYTAVTMPRFLSPARQPLWGQYAVTGAAQRWDSPTWIDPDAPRWRERGRAVTWLSATP